MNNLRRMDGRLLADLFKLKEKPLELTLISDGGHAWLKVSKNLFNKTNRKMRHISCYSYEDDKNYYLEEDVDATNYIQNLKELNFRFNISEIDDGEYSSIRNLKRVAI